MTVLARSEEQTSELQSLRHLVCRLLLEKKNKAPNDSPVKAAVNARHNKARPRPQLPPTPSGCPPSPPAQTSSGPASPFFFFNDPATTEIYTLSLHDALPISRSSRCGGKYEEEAGDRSARSRW